jgi:hypothetical protein
MLGRNMDFTSYICSKHQADAQLAATYDVAVTNSREAEVIILPDMSCDNVGDRRMVTTE